MEYAVIALASLSLLVSVILLILLIKQRQDKLSEPLERMERRLLDAMARDGLSVEQKLEQIRQTTERRLEAMRGVVEEKLQKTLDTRISQSFSLVNERLEQVYKGLGEMQALAVGVGDLKKVLSNVKTRGILGEVQLGAILEELLSPEQYDTNVTTVPNSRMAVEYAIRMPGGGDGPVWLPIDSKFPADRYSALCDAYDTGDPAAIEVAAQAMRGSLRQSAKDIRDKYIQPPHTTEFGVLFLPFEGLYAEAVRRGMIEELQRDFRISIAGPATMGALLNSFQMGFRTLAIQKRSGEVWALLGQVKGEFVKFSDVLDKTKKRLEQAGDELDTLVGTRTRSIIRSLKDVESDDSDQMLT
ncbi:MAG: DNA recombination protein RmuC [Oscillospiraceae bacterium]|jgi:DNA recombination protein RmuC|nr:DNA recombination protein RmuC [Oscillospiraceae bacterium]